jgi:tRNA-binding EMAP/Myf-like protein
MSMMKHVCSQPLLRQAACRLTQQRCRASQVTVSLSYRSASQRSSTSSCNCYAARPQRSQHRLMSAAASAAELPEAAGMRLLLVSHACMPMGQSSEVRQIALHGRLQIVIEPRCIPAEGAPADEEEAGAPPLPTAQLDIRVGRIVEVDKHPDADRHVSCKVADTLVAKKRGLLAVCAIFRRQTAATTNIV